MKHRTMKKLLAGCLAAALLATALPVGRTTAQAAEKAPAATVVVPASMAMPNSFAP